jgi:hypothetical protein
MGILQLVAFSRLLCHRFEVDPNDLGEMDSCHCGACRARGKRRAAGKDRRAGLELAGAAGRDRRQSLWRSDLADRTRPIEAAAARQTQAAEAACACQAGPAKAGSSCQGSKAATSEAGSGWPAAEYPAAARPSALADAPAKWMSVQQGARSMAVFRTFAARRACNGCGNGRRPPCVGEEYLPSKPVRCSNADIRRQSAALALAIRAIYNEPNQSKIGCTLLRSPSEQWRASCCEGNLCQNQH